MKNDRISDLERIEIRLIVEGIFQHYGYDFRDYALPTIRRILWKRAKAEGLSTISALQERILHDSQTMDSLLWSLSIATTSLFRDPLFYRAIRQKVVPLMRTYPFIRIWHAGCSTGEEVYSMAILMLEEGLYDRTRIYATDFSENVLQVARAGSFPTKNVAEYSQNYLEAGGKASLTNYYSADDKQSSFHQSLLKNVFFSQHNLATDNSFLEFNLIFCRNVLIYFNKSLQNRVHDLLYRSLCRFGVLSLGKRECLSFTLRESDYKELDPTHKIFRKVN